MKTIKPFINKITNLEKVQGGALDDYWKSTVGANNSYKDEKLWTTEDVAKECWDGKLYVCE